MDARMILIGFKFPFSKDTANLIANIINHTSNGCREIHSTSSQNSDLDLNPLIT